MKYYHLTCLISPELTEEEIKNFSDKIISSLQEKGGVLDRIDKPAKKKLAYPIKKRDAAVSIQLTFYLNPEKLENFKKDLKENPQILRHLILVQAPPKIEKRKIAKPKPKVELKEIEKKLEEILKE